MSDPIFSVEDRVVVITGGLGQLGRQFTTCFATRGARVAIFDNRNDWEQRMQALDSLSPRVHLFRADITSKASLEAALEEVEGLWGTPDVLINNAGLDAPPDASASNNGPFENYPQELWQRILDVNLTGAFLCSQVIGGRMAKAGRGSIININSIYGLLSPDQRLYEYRRNRGEVFYKPVAYSVSKSGLLNLTRYLATYWAGNGVRVNTLTFGGVFNHQDSEFLKNYEARVPLARMAREDEYNGAVLFLASDASSYMTGANLIMDGGWSCW